MRAHRIVCCGEYGHERRRSHSPNRLYVNAPVFSIARTITTIRGIINAVKILAIKLLVRTGHNEMHSIGAKYGAQAFTCLAGRSRRINNPAKPLGFGIARNVDGEALESSRIAAVRRPAP